MNYKLRTDRIIKLFNQSIGRLHPTKIKNLTLASLLVAGHAAFGPRAGRSAFTTRSRRATCRHLLHPAGGTL